jgi:hypothetical protein
MNGGFPLIPSLRWLAEIWQSIMLDLTPAGGVMYRFTSVSDCSHS